MKRRGFLAGAAVALAATPAAARPPMRLYKAPRTLLSPPFTDGSGRELMLENFQGRVVLLSMWATWDVPCRKEMPALDRLQARLGSDDFHVLPLSIDSEGIDVVRRFYDEAEIRHLGIYLADELRAMLAFGVIRLPTTILIGRDGKEAARRERTAEWDSPEAIAQFQSVISQGNI